MDATLREESADNDYEMKVAKALSKYVKADDFGCCKCGPVPSKLCMYGSCCGVCLQSRNSTRMINLFKANTGPLDTRETYKKLLKLTQNEFPFVVTGQTMQRAAKQQNMRDQSSDGAAQVQAAAKTISNRNILLAASKKEKEDRLNILQNGDSSNLWASCFPWLMTCNTAWVLEEAVDRFLTKSNTQIEMVSSNDAKQANKQMVSSKDAQQANEFSAERMPMLRY